MHIRTFFLLFSFCLFVLAAPVRAESVGRFTAVEGNVVRIGSDGATAAVKLDDPVWVGDTVRTQSNGKAEITFADGSIIRLAADTRTEIAEYLVGEQQTRGKLSLLGGKIQSLVKKGLGFFGRTRRNRFEVHTPTAVVGVRGTDFFTYHQGDVSGAVFREGRGYCYSLQQPDNIWEISAGQAMRLMDPLGRPEIRRVSKQELEQHLKETAPRKDPGKGEKAPTADKPRRKAAEEKPGKRSRSDPGQKGGPEKRALGSEPREAFESKPPGNGLDLIDDPRQNQAMGEGPEQEPGRLTDNKPPPVSESIPDIVAENLPARFHNPHLDVMARYLLAESPKLYELPYTGVMAANPRENTQVSVDAVRGEAFSKAGGFTDGSGQLVGAIQPDETHQKAMQVHSEVSGGLVYRKSRGRYAGPTSDDWQMGSDSWTEAGSWLRDMKNARFSDGKIAGEGYMAWAEISHSLTGVGGGEVAGTFDPNQQTYETAEIWALVDTASFLRLAREEAGRKQLAELNIPCVEIGKTDLAGSSQNLSVSVKDVTFFAYSTGDLPRIWATESVSGTYQADPLPEDTVTLTGEGIEAQFEVTRWESKRWGAAISGSGALKRSDRPELSDIDFKGTGAGEYGDGRFSGTAAGLAE